MKPFSNLLVICVGLTVADILSFIPLLQFVALVVTIVYTILQAVLIIIKLKKKNYE